MDRLISDLLDLPEQVHRGEFVLNFSEGWNLGSRSLCGPCKAVGLQGVQFPSGQCRSHLVAIGAAVEVNETVGAFETNASLWRCSEQAGPRFSGKNEQKPILSPRFLAWSARAGRAVRPGGNCFNPRPRVGGDEGPAQSAGPTDVSIHAPAWGATPGCRRVVVPTTSFNPRPRVGGDVDQSAIEAY